MTELSTNTAQIMIGSADLWPEVATAAHTDHWAKAYVNDNPAFRWVVAKYVEASAPNRNNNLWSPEDLKASTPSVENIPMNMLHKHEYIVGSFTGAKYMETDHNAALAQEAVNPYIEVVGPFWRYYFPNELATIEAAYKEGKLFVSMECVAEVARWHAASGETKDFEFMGPHHPSYGEWDSPRNVCQFVRPHFLGGGLIVPPVQPGWGGAVVREIAEVISKHSEEAEDIYEAVASIAPHLSPSEWESIMITVMRGHKNSELL